MRASRCGERFFVAASEMKMPRFSGDRRIRSSGFVRSVGTWPALGERKIRALRGEEYGEREYALPRARFAISPNRYVALSDGALWPSPRFFPCFVDGYWTRPLPPPSRVLSCSFFGATCLGALIEPIESNVCVRESNLANTNASGRLRSLFSENTLALSTSRPLFFPYFFVTPHPSFQLNTAARRKEQFRSRDSETGSRARMSNQPGIAVEINQASPADLAIKMTRLIDLQQAEVITRALRVRVSARSRSRSARPLAPRRLSQLRFPDQSR